MNCACKTILALLCALVSSGVGEDDKLIHLRDNLKQRWESISSIDLSLDEYILAKGESPNNEHRGIRYESSFDASGKSFFRVLSGSANTDVDIWSAQDGSRQFNIKVFNKTTTIDTIKVTSQPNGASEYSGIMNSYYWIIMPRGKPLHTLIDDGGTVSFTLKGNEESYATISTPYKGYNLSVSIDSAHDYWPRKVSIGDKVIYDVTSYGRIGGKWMPMLGTVVSEEEHNTFRKGFTVKNLSINEPIPTDKFCPMPPPNGVLVLDMIRKKNYYKGGREARKKLVDGHAPSKATDRTTGATIRIEAAESSSYIRLFVTVGVIVAATSIAAAIVLQRR